MRRSTAPRSVALVAFRVAVPHGIEEESDIRVAARAPRVTMSAGI
jgi:hypothetical protein